MRKALITAATRGREKPCLLPQRAAEKSPDDGRNASCVPCSPCPTPVPGDAAAARAAYYNGTAAATCPNQARCVGYGAVAVSQKPLLHLSHFFIWGPRAAPGFLQSGWEHTVILPSCARKPACSILELLPRTLGSASCCLAVDENRDCSVSCFLRERQTRGNEQPTPDPILRIPTIPRRIQRPRTRLSFRALQRA